jgi:hypothetical protein
MKKTHFGTQPENVLLISNTKYQLYSAPGVSISGSISGFTVSVYKSLEMKDDDDDDAE